MPNKKILIYLAIILIVGIGCFLIVYNWLIKKPGGEAGTGPTATSTKQTQEKILESLTAPKTSGSENATASEKILKSLTAPTKKNKSASSPTDENILKSLTAPK